jgi:hypothetical protein
LIHEPGVACLCFESLRPWSHQFGDGHSHREDSP